MIRRLAGMLWQPRATQADVVADPAWLAPWLVVLAVPLLCGLLFLQTDMGPQALVDEQVRLTEVAGGTVNDAAYAALQARPPYLVYLLSGGRVLLNPLITVAVAAALAGLARADGAPVAYRTALAATVHASVVLAVGQVVALPLDIVRESVSNPTTLVAVMPGLDDGTVAAAFVGALDVFGLWWLAVLAIGLSVMTGRSAWRYVVRLGAAYLAVAGALVAGLAALGGS
ncbi:MAG: YIP1 family protein [Vicinamibacterales bacterium]